MAYDKNYDYYPHTKRYHQQHMASISGKYRKEFVYEFREACDILNITQSSVYRDAMQKVIDEAKKKKRKA